MEKISVAVRFRPANPIAAFDPSPGSGSAGADREWRVDDGSRVTLIHRAAGPIPGASFAFDHVFDGATANERVYASVVRALIRSAVDGFNGTAFAYGQTSSGKTFTMNGSDADPGIIPRAVRDVFDTARQAEDREFLIRVSYMEIYNEEINDLLSLEGQKLQIHESLKCGVYVAGLREEIVNSAEQVFDLLRQGEVNRHFGETNMNVRSSRSHTIFRMVIESSAKNQMDSSDAIRVSVLNLVDLAGSERIYKTGAEGVRLNEGKHINKSLMILGNVINKLSENVKQRGHIPYRDSKLTRILQPALGGNAKTSIICTAAPEEIHIEETRGTLQFASRAKCVSNCAQVNEILTDAALLKRQKLEIEELRKKLQGSHSEGLEQVVLKLRNDMYKSELERDRLAMELEEERKLRETLERRVAEQQKKLEDVNNTSMSAEHFSDSTQLDALRTPDSKYTTQDFVACRLRYSNDVEFSPIPETLDNIADEDLWARLNKGCVTDLGMLEMTPGLKREESMLKDTTSAVPLEEPVEARCQRVEKDCISDHQQLEVSKGRCVTLEEQLDMLKDENMSLKQEVSESKQEANHIIAKKQEQLEDSRTRCAALEKERLHMVKDENLSLQHEVSKSKQEAHGVIAEKQEQLDDSRTRSAALEKELEMLKNENLSLQQEVSKSKQEANHIIAEKQEQLEDSRTRFAALEKELDMVKDENLSLQHEVSKSKQEAHGVIAEKQEQLDDSRTRSAALEKELEMLKNENLSLQQEVSKSKQEPNHIIAEKQEQLEDSRTRFAALEKELDMVKDENLSLQHEVSKSKQEAHGVIAEKQEQLDDSRTRSAALEKELFRYKQDADRLAAEKDELLGELNAEKQKMQELRKDISVIIRTFSQREGQLTSLYSKSKAILERCKSSQVDTLP